MDKILAMTEKQFNLVPSAEELSNLCHKNVAQRIKVNCEEAGRVKDEQKELDALKEKVKNQEEEYTIECQKYDTLNNELAKHTDTMKTLMDKRMKLYTKNEETESRRNQLKIVKPSTADKQTLEIGRKKLSLYKNLTGIRWDFPALKSSTVGFTTNSDDYAKAFDFNLNDSKTEEKLWKEIEKAATYKFKNPNYDES